MQCIIIDDDKKVCNMITNYLTSYFPAIQPVAIEHTKKSGLQAISKHSPQLVLLDIELPDGTGFDLIRECKNICFKVIFITGHQEYAIQAIRVSALDYILKPIDFDSLSEALERAKKEFILKEEQEKLRTFLDNQSPAKHVKRIILKTAECLHVVNTEDIIRCQADNNYTFFFLKERKKILVSRTLKEYYNILKDTGFIRIHQSHVINLKYIDKIMKTGGGYILLSDGTEIPVSTANKHRLLEEIEKYRQL